MCPLLGLAPGGVCLASPVARPAVGSYPTLSPFPFGGSRKVVCFLWHFPSACAGRPLAVALSCWSPDFPPARSYPRTSGCPAFWSVDVYTPSQPAGEGRLPCRAFARLSLRSIRAPEAGVWTRANAGLRRPLPPATATFFLRSAVPVGPRGAGHAAAAALLPQSHTSRAHRYDRPSRGASRCARSVLELRATGRICLTIR